MNTTASPIPIASAFRDSVESVVVVVDVAVVLVLVLVLVLVDMVVGGQVETAAYTDMALYTGTDCLCNLFT